MQDQTGRDNRTRLEAAAGPVLAVELDVEPEQHDEGNQQAADDLRHDVMAQPDFTGIFRRAM